MSPDHAATPDRPLVRRLLSRKGALLLFRNTIVSNGVFAFDMALLWLLVARFAMDKTLAVTLAFIAANSLHYVFGRGWIFRGTDRGVAEGYVLFLVNAGVGLILTVGLFAILTTFSPLDYRIARVLVSIVAGLVVFVLNAVFNFRQL